MSQFVRLSWQQCVPSLLSCSLLTGEENRHDCLPMCSDQLRCNLVWDFSQHSHGSCHPFPVIPEGRRFQRKRHKLQLPFPGQIPFSSSLALIVPPLLLQFPPSTPVLHNEIIILQTKS